MPIGVISDTHGLLRPEAVEALRGSDHIIHAGDVGAPEILDQLRAIAPLTAIRGNIDKAPWARDLPETEVVEIEGLLIYVVHDLGKIDLKSQSGRFCRGDQRPQPCSEAASARWCAVFQSGKRGAAAVQLAGFGWKADGGGWRDSGGDSFA